MGEGPAFGLGEVGEEQLGDGGDGEGHGPADTGVHAHRVAAVDLVDVHDLVVLVQGEVNGVPGGLVQLGQVGAGDVADVEVLDGLGGEREEACAEAVAAVGAAVDVAALVQGAQQAQRGALVHAELVGDLAESGGPPCEQRQDAERSFDRLAHRLPFPTVAAPPVLRRTEQR